MIKFFFTSVVILLPLLLSSQNVIEIDGKLKVGSMDSDPSNNDIVVRQDDGTLALRNAQDLVPNFTVSFTGDTLYQSGGDWIILPGISNANNATYRVTFNSVWSAQTHPTSFPSFPHFSGLIGMTHNSNGTLFQPGTLASLGIKNMAETGSKSSLSAEIDALIGVKQAQSIISGGGIGLSPGTVSVEFQLSKSHDLISLVSMVAPSPDWFIGVRDISLFENGTWVQSKTVQVNVYDSGTDSGTSYASPNNPTSPAGPIFMITTAPLGTNGVVPSLGTMTFERIDN